MWSLLAGVIGVIIRTLEERLAFVGRLVAGLIGLAWSVASIFAIPILAREPSFSNPFAILSKSAETIKRTWGEMLAGYVGMQGTKYSCSLGLNPSLGFSRCRSLPSVQRLGLADCWAALVVWADYLWLPGKHCQSCLSLCALFVRF